LAGIAGFLVVPRWDFTGVLAVLWDPYAFVGSVEPEQKPRRRREDVGNRGGGDQRRIAHRDGLAAEQVMWSRTDCLSEVVVKVWIGVGEPGVETAWAGRDDKSTLLAL
jgi:hypothetical protein